jgi:hypothetical protein
MLRNFIYLCLFIILIGCFIYLGKKDFKEKITDGEKFSKEYTSIPKDNMFVYVKSYEVLDKLNGKDGIILMGFSSNEWMQEYVKYLYNVLKENNVTKVYYYDLLEDRTRNTKNYIKIKEYLKDYLLISDSGTSNLFTPLLLFIKDGNVVYLDNESFLVYSNNNPIDYWTLDKVTSFSDRIDLYLGGYNYNEK